MNTIPTSPSKQFEDRLILKALCTSAEPTAIYSDQNMLIQFANSGMLKLWGKDASVIGMPLLEALPELVDQPIRSILEGVWNSGESYTISGAPIELRQYAIERTGHYDCEYKALVDETGKTWCILNTARKVTSEKEFLQKMRQKERNEKSLKTEMSETLEELFATNQDLIDSMTLLSESREHVRTIIEQAPVGITMLKGPEHIIELANPAILNIWGRVGKEVIGLPHRIARPELAGQPVFNWLDQVYTTGERKTNKEFTVNLYHNGGSREAIVNSIYQPIFSAAGEVTGVLVILEEITEQVIARRINEKDKHMLELAIDAGQLATFYYEPVTNRFAGNQLLQTWFGLEPAEHIDLSKALSVIVDDDRQRVSEAIARSLTGEWGGNYAIEYRIKALHDTSPRLVQARGQVFYDSAGRAVSLNGTLRDITEQKRDEQRKDDFIGMVSHELKTPLTSLKAYLQLMQRHPIVPDEHLLQNSVEKSLRQVQNMTSMINGFLNISRLDSGKMVLDKSIFDLEILFNELREDLDHTVQSHRFFFETQDNAILCADREKIGQVLHNLVGNAVKYSPLGSQISLSYAITDKRTIEIHVTDEGMGVPEEDKEKIFERYYRSKNMKMGSISGFGIGLYLCREIIELHNGTIGMERRTTIGSTFKLVLPLGIAEGGKENLLIK